MAGTFALACLSTSQPDSARRSGAFPPHPVCDSQTRPPGLTVSVVAAAAVVVVAVVVGGNADCSTLFLH